MTTRKKAPRPKIHGNAAQREKIMCLLASGASLNGVAASVGLTAAQMKHLYPQTVEMGAELGFCQLALLQWKQAKNGKVSAIDKLMVRAERIMAGEAFVKPEEEDERSAPSRHKLGKKEIAALEAETAGQGTAWGEDLHLSSVN
jgi:hypothetical protein